MLTHVRSVSLAGLLLRQPRLLVAPVVGVTALPLTIGVGSCIGRRSTQVAKAAKGRVLAALGGEPFTIGPARHESLA